MCRQVRLRLLRLLSAQVHERTCTPICMRAFCRFMSKQAMRAGATLHAAGQTAYNSSEIHNKMGDAQQAGKTAKSYLTTRHPSSRSQSVDHKQSLLTQCVGASNPTAHTQLRILAQQQRLPECAAGVQPLPNCTHRVGMPCAARAQLIA